MSIPEHFECEQCKALVIDLIEIGDAGLCFNCTSKLSESGGKDADKARKELKREAAKHAAPWPVENGE